MDEPLIKSIKIENDRSENQPQVDAKTATERVMATELYGVLATQNNVHPYTSLVAYAHSSDLKYIIFTTPKTTRKYAYLESCPDVAFQVDNRPKKIEDLMVIESLTATATAHQINPKEKDYNKFKNLLLGKHHYLEQFIKAPTSALYCIHVKHFFHVVRFQEVAVISP